MMKICEVCGSAREEVPGGTDDDDDDEVLVVNDIEDGDGEDDEQSDSHLDEGEKLAHLLMQQFSTTKGGKIECRLDGKQHSTANLMRIHFLKVWVVNIKSGDNFYHTTI